jgi:hypothetical protein
MANRPGWGILRRLSWNGFIEQAVAGQGRGHAEILIQRQKAPTIPFTVTCAISVTGCHITMPTDLFLRTFVLGQKDVQDMGFTINGRPIRPKGTINEAS